MSGIRESLDWVSLARLERYLERASADKYTGALRVAGRPGGTLYLRDGLIVGAESPGAPGLQALLVRTGRIDDDAWVEAGGAPDKAAAVGAIGDAHFQVIRVMATQDALFAMLAGSVDACGFEDEGQVPEGIGDDVGDLLAVAFRKLEALSALPRSVMPDRERLVPASGYAQVPGADDQPAHSKVTNDSISVRETILRYADGRRTARGVAFVAGRSLYAVTVEMSRMLDEGLLVEAPPVPVETGPGDLPLRLVPRRTRPATPPVEPRTELPRRQRPAAAADTAPDGVPEQKSSSWKDLLRLGGRTEESHHS